MAALGVAYAYWKVLGLCPFVLSDNDTIRVSHSGLIYPTILAVLYTACYLRAVSNRTSYCLPRESPISIIADFGGLSVEFVLIVSSWFCVGLRQKQVQKILLFFKKIQKTYERLGIRVENTRLLKDVKIHTIVVNLVYCILCVVDHLLMVKYGAFNLTVWLPFNLPRIVSHNIMIMFANAMRAIEQRFSSLNQKIQKLPYEVTTKIIVRQRNGEKNANGSGFKSYVTPGSLKTYGQIHSDLIDLAKVVVDFFSFSILFVMMTHLIQILSGLYTLCLVTKDRTIWFWRDIASSMILVLWFVVHFTELAFLFSVSDSTSYEANQTGNSLHKMLLMSCADRYKDSAKILSLRLLQRKLSIDLFGLLQMRLSMIHRVMGIVATYITVMVQLDDQEALGN